MTSKLRTRVGAPLFTVALALGVAAPSARAQAQPGVIPDTIDPEAPVDFPYTPPPDPNATAAPQTTEVSYAPETSYATDAYAADPSYAQAASTDGLVDDLVADSYDDGYDPMAYRQFEDALAAYGSWVEDPRFGMVWVPASSVVGGDFMPYYSNGNWQLTEFGWTWVSTWSWGWAPFHYGRWVVTPGWGWSWIPGTMWGPAWVSWRMGGGYVGWAPLPPRGVVLAANLGPTSPWRFTTNSGLGASRLSCLPPQRLSGVWRGTAVVSNDRLLSRGSWTVHINAGPTGVVRKAPVQLAEAAPQALPKLRILPQAGTSLGNRPWTRVFNEAPSRQGSPARGAPAGGRAPAPAPAFRGGPAPAFRGGPAPAFAPTPASNFRTSTIRPATPPIRAAASTPFQTPFAARTLAPHAEPAPAPAPAAQAAVARPETPAFHSPEPAFRTPRPAFPGAGVTAHTAPTFPGAGMPAHTAPSTFPNYTAQPFRNPASVYVPRAEHPQPTPFPRPQPTYAPTPAPQASPVRMSESVPRVVREPSFTPPPARAFTPPPARAFAPAPTPQQMTPPAMHLGNPGAARFGGGAHRR